MWKVFFILFFVAKVATAESLFIARGASQWLSLAPVEQVRVSNGKVLTVVDQGPKLKLTGKKNGQSYLYIGNRQYTVWVVDPIQAEEMALIKQATSNFMGLEIGWNNAVAVSGRLHRFSDWLAIANLPHKTNYQFTALVDEDVKPEVEKYFRARLEHLGVTAFHLQWNPHFAVSVPESLKDKSENLSKELSPFGLTPAWSKDQVALLPLVRVNIVVAEIDRGRGLEFGVEWPKEYEATVLPKLRSPEELLVKLRALEQVGSGQILASPTLLSRSGSKAEFLAGGEFPILIKGFGTQNVQWKKHGILLTMKPVADHRGHMSIELETEVSLIDSSQVVNGVPGLKTNRISSHFDLQGSRTIALSGLIKHETGKFEEGIPVLKEIPILGQLFKSESFLKRKSELVVFVTPSLVTNDSEPVQMPKGWQHDSQ